MTKVTSKVHQPILHRLPPGYFRTNRMLKRLRRFQSLIQHRERWADSQPVVPIEVLLPASMLQRPPFEIQAHLEKEILKAMHIIRLDIGLIGLPTVYTYNRCDKEEKYDLIMNYFDLPREDGMSHTSYQAVIQLLEQVIGTCETRLTRAKQEMINPYIWLVHIVRFPITVAESAGLGDIIASAAQTPRILLIFVIYLVACGLLLLGIKLPWKDGLWRAIELASKL